MTAWLLEDPAGDGGFTFPINPRAGGGFTRGRRTSTVRTTTGGTITFLGRLHVADAQIEGIVLLLRDKANIDNWFRTQRQLRLTDDLGRTTWVYMTELNWTPEPKRRHHERHSYTARLVELTVPTQDWP